MVLWILSLIPKWRPTLVLILECDECYLPLALIYNNLEYILIAR
jgi:hypothetical protein